MQELAQSFEKRVFKKSGLDLFLHIYLCEPISFSQQNIKITVTLVHSAHTHVHFVQCTIRSEAVRHERDISNAGR